MPARLPRRLGALLLALPVLLVAGFASSCGGDEEDVNATLERAFDQPIGSADVSLNVDLQLEGSEQFSEPIRLQVTGPYKSGAENMLPSFDWDLNVSGGGASAGQIPPLGLISTGDNVFVGLQDQAYEVGEDTVSQALEDQAQQGEGLAALGVDPRSWITEETSEGEEEVAGVPATHVSGAIEVPKMLSDLNQVAQRSGGTAGAQQAPELTQAQIDEVERLVGSPRFDLFTGRDDGKVRRLSANLDFTVPEAARAQAGGLSGGTLAFSIEFANVGGDQQVSAPEKARPISDLVEQLGGLGGILGQGALPGGDPQGAAAPRLPPSRPLAGAARRRARAAAPARFRARAGAGRAPRTRSASRSTATACRRPTPRIRRAFRSATTSSRAADALARVRRAARRARSRKSGERYARAGSRSKPRA